jgi:soluble lytic murein transglycosylase-like protein
MKPQQVLLVVLISIASIVLLCSLEINSDLPNKKSEVIEFGHKGDIGKPASMVMYENLERCSKEYGIPKHIIYNIAFLETRYEGPFDWNYDPARTSCVGAIGPMQIMPSTANSVHKTVVSISELKTNISFNIETSAKVLQRLYKKYGDWATVCGCYNTGKPMINGYARFCESNKNYQKNWVYIKL